MGLVVGTGYVVREGSGVEGGEAEGGGEGV